MYEWGSRKSDVEARVSQLVCVQRLNVSQDNKTEKDAWTSHEIFQMKWLSLSALVAICLTIVQLLPVGQILITLYMYKNTNNLLNYKPWDR